MKDIDGKTYPAALDIDPDVLFEMTINTMPSNRTLLGILFKYF
jgi:hypothetical protein